MPDFIVEVTSKTIYGPFTYPSASQLRSELVQGNLKLDKLIIDADCPTNIKIKEVKPEK